MRPINDQLNETTVDLRLLGPLELKLNGGEPPPDLLWRKNAGLLVYLACSPDHRRTREHLIGLLWGDKTDAAARQSLREALRILRRCLGAGCVLTERDDVALNVSRLSLDTALFIERERHDPTSALQLVRGTFLEGFVIPKAPDYENWLASLRSEWQQRAAHAFARATDRLLRSGNARAAGILASNGLQVDPASDNMARLAMRSLALSGDRSAALKAYETFRTELESLGAVPESATDELARRIRQERSWSIAAQSTDPRGIRRPPLVGRSNEVSNALRLWKACISDSVPTLVTVESDPGVGKTRLAEEILGHARLDGALVLSVRGIAADEEHAWIGLRSLASRTLLDAPGLATASAESLGAFAEHLSEWSARFPGLDAGSADSLDRAMADVLTAVAAEQPVLVLLDDAHFLDAETLRAIDLILRDVQSVPLLVWINTVSAVKRIEVDRLRSRIGRDVKGANFVLKPFEETDVQELVDAVMQHIPRDHRHRLARRVVMDSGGIPLLAVELLYAVEYGMTLDTIPSDWPKPEHTLTQTMPGELPEATRFAIRVGYRTLSQEAQNVLCVAAVAGELVTLEGLCVGTDRSRAELVAAVDELEWQRWLEADGRGYTFVARIVRDVILEDMLTSGQRRRIEETLRS